RPGKCCKPHLLQPRASVAEHVGQAGPPGLWQPASAAAAESAAPAIAETAKPQPAAAALSDAAGTEPLQPNARTEVDADLQPAAGCHHGPAPTLDPRPLTLEQYRVCGVCPYMGKQASIMRGLRALLPSRAPSPIGFPNHFSHAGSAGIIH